MLEFYTGVPGSGKTYRAVDHVYNCFIDSKHKLFGKYKCFYTNINEFHFDFFNKPSIPSSDLEEVKPFVQLAYNLEFDLLIKNLSSLRALYLAKNPDSVLLEFADTHNLTGALFVIDEAHNYFDDKNDVLVWWLSYHRHLNQDIILITQNLSLIYKKYLTFGEFFYRAVPSSLRIRGGVFTYHQFIKHQLYKSSHTDTIKVKFNEEVFSLYGSGANTQGKKVIYKFIIIAVVLLAFALLLFKVLLSMVWGNDTNTSKSSSTPIASSSPVDISSTFTVICIGSDCSYLGNTISSSELNFFETKYNLLTTSKISVNDGVILHTFARNDKFLNEVLHVTSNTTPIN